MRIVDDFLRIWETASTNVPGRRKEHVDQADTHTASIHKADQHTTCPRRLIRLRWRGPFFA